jgi:integrase
MANLYLYLDMRTPHANGAGSLKMAFTHKHKTSYEPLGIYVTPEEWSKDKQQVVLRPDKKFLNVIIKKRMAEGTLALQRILLRKDVEELTSKQILEMIVRGTDTADKPETEEYVLPVYNEYITIAKKPSTAATYRASLKSIVEFEPDVDSLRFKDITVAWLRRYQNWLTGAKGMEVNGANVYLRNLRTIFNYALVNKYTFADYPFKKIDMSTTEPDKRTIQLDKFLEWYTKPMDDYRNFYRDLFMLSFYLCGIRPVDLLHVKKSQVEDGRLVYWPEKLNGRTKLSIKIEPEAWAIIKKYEGGEYLLNIMENRSDYKAFMQHWNRALKAIGEDETYEKTGRKGRVYTKTKHVGIIPYISIYYARTCWASFAYNDLDAPMDVISQALGHKSGLKVTNFYVKRGEKKVDLLNRSMIDMMAKVSSEYRRKHGIA